MRGSKMSRTIGAPVIGGASWGWGREGCARHRLEERVVERETGLALGVLVIGAGRVEAAHCVLLSAC
jgi:hypothetical protein